MTRTECILDLQRRFGIQSAAEFARRVETNGTESVQAIHDEMVGRLSAPSVYNVIIPQPSSLIIPPLRGFSV